MSNAPHKAADNVNIFGIVLIGVASTFLLWATAVALQGYYLNTAGEVEDDRAAEQLTDQRRSINAAQQGNLHRAEENSTYKGSAETCFRNPIENAMKAVVSSAQAGNASLVPAVGAHDARTIAPIPGYPSNEGSTPTPAKLPADPNRVVIADKSITLGEKITFAKGTAELTPEAELLLSDVAAVLGTRPELQLIEIGAHTGAGDATANLELSNKRAEAVVAFLTSKKIAAERLQAVGYGQEKPVADNGTPEGLEQNNRVELLIVKKAEPAPAPEPAPEPAPAPAPAPAP